MLCHSYHNRAAEPQRMEVQQSIHGASAQRAGVPVRDGQSVRPGLYKRVRDRLGYGRGVCFVPLVPVRRRCQGACIRQTFISSLHQLSTFTTWKTSTLFLLSPARPSPSPGIFFHYFPTVTMHCGYLYSSDLTQIYAYSCY